MSYARLDIKQTWLRYCAKTPRCESSSLSGTEDHDFLCRCNNKTEWTSVIGGQYLGCDYSKADDSLALNISDAKRAPVLQMTISRSWVSFTFFCFVWQYSKVNKKIVNSKNSFSIFSLFNNCSVSIILWPVGLFLVIQSIRMQPRSNFGTQRHRLIDLFRKNISNLILFLFFFETELLLTDFYWYNFFSLVFSWHLAGISTDHVSVRNDFLEVNRWDENHKVLLGKPEIKFKFC